jgi:hypothetical protein
MLRNEEPDEFRTFLGDSVIFLAFSCCFRWQLRIRGESGGIMPMNIINAG